jgi:hypothetical protein
MLAKRLPRGGGLGPGWKRSDLYFGAEFTLAGVAAALVNVCELFLNPERPWKDSYKTLGFANFLVAFFGLVLFMYVLTMHEEYKNESNVGDARLREIKMLAVASNMLGFIVLLMGVVLTPGV